LQQLDVRRDGQLVCIDVRANGFLHNMVRILAGCLIRIGKGEADANWLLTVLNERDRTRAAMTAPPQGLSFVQPTYPHEYGIPDFTAQQIWK